MYWQRISSLFLGFIILGSQTVFSAPIVEPAVTAKAAIVMEASTGKVLYAKNAEETKYPASTTKIMTLIVALEKGNMDEYVTASQKASETEGSSLWLSPGEKLKMLDLLYGIMLISGNDATVAVAEHIAGSVERYAEVMTAKAHEIGAVNTHFTNTSGLPDPNHYTTAHDLALITAYGYHNPLFAKIVSTQHKTLPWAGKSYDRDLYNENKMLWMYDGANGVKTGYTDAAGRCLVSAANRNHIQLICVVMDSTNMWSDSMALLDYGFSQVNPFIMVQKGDIMKTVRVNSGMQHQLKLLAADSVIVPASENDRSHFSTEIEVPTRVEAPIEQGQKIGTIKVRYDNKDIGEVDLIAEEAVQKKSFFGRLWSSIVQIITICLKNIA